MKRYSRTERVILVLGAGLVLALAAAASAAPPPGKPAAFCGNGTVEKNEQCDQNSLNGETCQLRGFNTGTLSCGANCQFDTSQCSNQRFVDNGDGTITDFDQGLMWEKKVTGPLDHLRLTRSGQLPALRG